jgi:hypothetical protein
MSEAGVIDSLLIELGFGGNLPGQAAKIEKSLDSLLNAAGLLVNAINAVGAAFVGMGLYATEAGDETAATAEQLGVTTEALSGLRYAAVLSDASVEALDAGLRIFNRTLGQAEIGSKAARQAFADMGLDFRDLAKMPADKAVAAVAGALSRVESPAKRAALAAKVFGRGAVQLIPLLNRGAEGIDALTDASARFGNTITTKDAAAAGELDDSIKRLTARAEGLRLRIGFGVIPALQRWADALEKVYDANVEVIGQQIDKAENRRA